MRRRQVVGTLAGTLVGGLAGCTGGSMEPEDALVVSSPPLDGETLPAEDTCDGAGRSPLFSIEHVPDPTAVPAVAGE
jgi:hypothetical protein